MGAEESAVNKTHTRRMPIWSLRSSDSKQGRWVKCVVWMVICMKETTGKGHSARACVCAHACVCALARVFVCGGLEF